MRTEPVSGGGGGVGETYAVPQDPARTRAPHKLQGSAVVLLGFLTICEQGGPRSHFLPGLANYVAGSRTGSRSGQERRTSSRGKRVNCEGRGPFPTLALFLTWGLVLPTCRHHRGS